ncbi:MAG: potassium transporter TrkG, partial [Lachnospiraceae bacterium]|nr:potassium transporter TrkG [Lachnospiraceae bacterium]
MNWKRIIKILGFIMLVTSAFMVLPMIVAFIYHEKDWIYFLITIAGLAVIGLPLIAIRPKNKNFFSRDGFLIVALAWIVMGLAGAVPLCISGLVPDYINAVFESVSGFTTSGISILPNVEAASHSLLFWRSLTHWIGGMGVLVFMLALSPVSSGSSMHIMRAEAPGPTTEKLSPKISQTAKWLYVIYLALTLIEALALSIAKLGVYQSFLISFGTLATGGFSFLNSSLAAFTHAQQVIVIVFMVLAGVNFSLFFLIATGKFRKALTDTELWCYLGTIAVVVILLTLNV